MLNKSAVAVELFSAGWCNLNCSYCYITKKSDKLLMKFHKKIIENIKNGTLLKQLEEKFGDKLEYISHWGTEPTLTLHLFKDFYKQAVEKFPNLKGISFSSNFMTSYKIITDFIENLPKKPLQIKIQISLDGPHYYTDRNRVKGSTDKIVENIYKFIEETNKLNTNHKILIHFKPTLSRDDYEYFSENAFEYYQFFDKIFDNMVKLNKNNKIQISFGCDPTIVVPQDYTKQDGQNLLKVYQAILHLQKHCKFKYIKPQFNYYNRFLKTIRYGKEFFIKTKMFTCSAGDTMFSLDEEGNILPCHRAFYIKDKEFNETTLNDNEREITTEKKNILAGRVDVLANKFISKDWNHYFVLRNRIYHDFQKLAISNIIAKGLELAEIGDINSVYRKNEKLLELVAIFIYSVSCPMENIVSSASITQNDYRFLRLFCNGVFETMLKEFISKEL